MLKIKEDSQNFEATPAFQELDDEVAATCSGGTVTLYEHGNFNANKDGKVMKLNKSNPNIGRAFNDITSSIKITKGVWGFYADEQYNKLLFKLGKGDYRSLPNTVDGSNPNDRITSVRRVDT